MKVDANDDFSVAALAGLCSSISRRTASSTGELEGLAHEHLSALSALVEPLNRQAARLGEALKAAPFVAERLRRALHDALASADAATGRLHKQLMRVQPDTVAAVDAAYVQTQGLYLAACTLLFGYLGRVLALDDGRQQDAALGSIEGQALFEQASGSLTAASLASSILLDGGAPGLESGPSSLPLRPNKPDEPPPYVSQAPPLPSTSQAGPSSPRGLGFSFTNSIKALASSFTSKPDAFVSALCQAVLRGDVQQIGGLVSQGVNINGRNEDGNTPLRCAMMADQVEAARLLLAAGANLQDSRAWSGTMPPLFQAASAGSLGIARLLLEKGSRVSELSVSGQPYFVDVCAGGNLAGIEFLLQNGAEPTWQSLSGRPVLVRAVKKGNLELARLLLKYGADANACDITGSSALALAAEKDDAALAELLLDHGAEPDSITIYGTSVLADAISRGRLDMVRLLLDRGASGDRSDLYGQPLIVCILKDARIEKKEKAELIRRLLENGATPNAQDMTGGDAALCYALQAGLSDATRTGRRTLREPWTALR